MIPHIAAGVDISCKEEHSHFQFSSWVYRQLMLEESDLGLIDDEAKEALNKMCAEIAYAVYDHEKKIIDMIFEKGNVRTISKEEILHFVRNRIDVCLQGLNCEPMFGDEDGVVSDWFYDALSTYKFADFFANNQIQYIRSWSKTKLKFNLEVAND